MQRYFNENNARFRNAGGNPSIAFLYLNSQTQQSECHLLGCIIRQLVEDQKTLPEVVKQQWANYSQDESALARQGLIDLLIRVTTERNPVYIVIDALDESPAAVREPLMEALTSLSSEIGLMITSRYMGNFEQLFSGFCRVNISADQQDILEFVNHIIDQNARLLGFTRTDKSLRSDICKNIQKRSQDMCATSPLIVKSHANTLPTDSFSSDYIWSP